MSTIVDESATPESVSEVGVSAQTLTADSLVAGDPVFKFLHNTFGGALTVALNVTVAAVIFFGGAYLNDGLFNTTYKTPSRDYSTAVLFDRTTSLRKMTLIALGLTVYFLLPRLVAALFNNLRINSVVIDPRRDALTYEQFLKDMIRKMNLRLWPILGVLTVVVFWGLRAIKYKSAKRPVWLEVAALVAYALVFYVFIPTLAKLWIVLFSTNLLFRLFHVRVNPLHPDGAGGFGPVGRMFSTYILIFTAFGLLVASGMVSSYYHEGYLLGRAETWMLIVGYTSVPVLIWGWLWTPHKAMREARDRKLLVLAEEFLQATPGHDDARPADAPLLKENTERLSELKKQYELLIDSYPTWPVRFQQVNRLVALVSAPLITTALPHIISTLGILVSKR
jgi:hypothetical protein